MFNATEYTDLFARETAAAKKGAGRAAAEVAKAKRSKDKDARDKDAKGDRDGLAQKVENRVDKRQDHQAKRIEEGIKKGYLTQDEISKLDAQQKNIASMESSFKSDGKVTKAEATQLRSALNEASLCIFAEKHDADGSTKSVPRLENNVILKNDVAQKLGDENLSRQDARVYLKDFHRMMDLKKTLSTGNLSDSDRTSAQNEYNDLLNKYFDTK